MANCSRLRAEQRGEGEPDLRKGATSAFCLLGFGVAGSSKLRISAPGLAESDGVLVTVRDSGPGLPSSSLEGLFDSFHATKADGMGMGLVDLPLDQRSSRRTILGVRERAPRRRLPIHRACPPRAFLISLAIHAIEI
jgi:hypothetical protein